MVIAAHFEEPRQQAGPSRDPRRILRLEAQGLTASGDSTRVLVHNISASGLLLESAASLAAGELIDIDLPHAGPTSARVMWVGGNFCGCQFDAPISAAALSAAQLRSAVRDAGGAAVSQAPAAGEPFEVRLQRLRKERGLTLAQLASVLGVSKPTVWAWEQGRARPVEARIEALAEALDVPVGEMLLERSPSILPELIARAKEQIAGALGITSDKIRIVVDL
jgi:transcriptional regulator with XRE-family HTH domain